MNARDVWECEDCGNLLPDCECEVLLSQWEDQVATIPASQMAINRDYRVYTKSGHFLTGKYTGVSAIGGASFTFGPEFYWFIDPKVIDEVIPVEPDADEIQGKRDGSGLG